MSKDNIILLNKCKVCGFMCSEYYSICLACGVKSEKDSIMVTAVKGRCGTKDTSRLDQLFCRE